MVNKGPSRAALVECLCFALILLLTPLAAFGQPQVSQGTLFGIVVGAGGESYGGVKAALMGSDGFSQTQSTREDGQFRFTSVPAGPFRITLSSSGFEPRTIEGTLAAGQSLDLQNVVLRVAKATTSVTVKATSDHEIAQQQLNSELKQRILGVVPNFYVVYDNRFAPLTAKQKFHLAMRSNLDVVTFLGAGVVAGVEQADDSFPAYGSGASGYATRFAQAYGDGFISNLVGNGLLASVFRQDPRFFVKSTGSVSSRIWYSAYTSVLCKGDNGKWQVNYSGIIGGIAASGISDLYYPAQNRNGAAVIFQGAGLGLGTNVLQNLAQEFFIKKITPHAGN